jgi:hypothetical protein
MYNEAVAASFKVEIHETRAVTPCLDLNLEHTAPPAEVITNVR